MKQMLIDKLLPCVLAFGTSMLTGCGPCQLYANGQCYDRANAAMPPLTASWQLMDVETGKGIEGAWVSLDWYGPRQSGKPATCMRSVLGRTNQDGRFSSTGKDGSEWFGNAHFLAPGYQKVRVDVLQDFLSAYVDLSPGDREIYAPWIRSLEQMGYKYVDAGGRLQKYVKLIPWPKGFEGYYRRAFDPGGSLILMVTRRGLPYDNGLRGSIPIACKNAKEAHVGYDSPQGHDMTLKVMRTEAYQLACDPRWFLLPSVRMTETLSSHIRSALLLHPHKDKWELTQELAPRYAKSMQDDITSSTDPTSRLDKDEREHLCDTLKPYALPLPFPPSALAEDPQ